MSTGDRRAQQQETAVSAASQVDDQRFAARAPGQTIGIAGASFPAPLVLVPDAISGNAIWHSQKTAVVCGDRRLTWQEFNARANRVANALMRLGVQKGDKVSVLMPNSIEAAEVICGIVKAGCVVMPLSAQVPGPGLALQITDSDSKILFVGTPLNSAIAPHMTTFSSMIAGGFIAVGFEAGGWRLYEDLLEGVLETEPGIILTYDDDFNIMYSSGTTGVPKGIGVAEVAVIGIPHEKWGETTLGLVVCRPGASIGADELSVLAAVLLVLFQGSVDALIPLFAVGVFVAFTMSQAGMVVQW